MVTSMFSVNRLVKTILFMVRKSIFQRSFSQKYVIAMLVHSTEHISFTIMTKIAKCFHFLCHILLDRPAFMPHDSQITFVLDIN